LTVEEGDRILESAISTDFTDRALCASPPAKSTASPDRTAGTLA
jgi:hypothetical protein